TTPSPPVCSSRPLARGKRPAPSRPLDTTGASPGCATTSNASCATPKKQGMVDSNSSRGGFCADPIDGLPFRHAARSSSAAPRMEPPLTAFEPDSKLVASRVRRTAERGLTLLNYAVGLTLTFGGLALAIHWHARYGGFRA